MEALFKQNFSEKGISATQGLMYHNTQVIREMLFMLNSLCEQSSSFSPSVVSRSGERRPSSNYVDAKPINLAQHRSPNCDRDLLYHSPAKGQFICPNCGQDFLNRDALAMHMMESVHSEACANTAVLNSNGRSADDRVQKSIGCHHIKSTEPSPIHRYIRLPMPVDSNTVPLHALFQSIMKTRPQIDTSLPRPGRKPRRLLPVVVEAGGRQIRWGAEGGGPSTPKRPKSCESKVERLASNESQPDRARSTPGGVQAAPSASFADLFSPMKPELELSDSHKLIKVRFYITTILVKLAVDHTKFLE